MGSVETERSIAREAAEGLKEVTLELGGKNPIIVFPDANPASAAQAAISRNEAGRVRRRSRGPVNRSRWSPVLAPAAQVRTSRGSEVADAQGAPLATPISSRMPSTAASAPRISAGPRRPMQPMRNDGAEVSLPG